ncbi:MAG TPA: S8 family serine peptidase, partial [Candidatus Kapabacteria bacterium]|nr:S8 family serine peptidase [Candidatus Kapabacteria bacterium]
AGRGGVNPPSPSRERGLGGEVIPNDPLFYAQWWLENVHAPEAWQITEGDSTIHIGFVDTGVNWLHPDLKFQFAVNPAEDINHDGLFEAWPSDSLGVNARGDTVTGDLDGKDHDGNGYANDVIGYNFVGHEEPGLGDVSTRGPIPYDLNGHGTDMAGILAAQQDNHIGVSGIAPKCKLVPLRAFNADGTGSDDDIATAIVYAADNHIQILSLSFGDVIPSLLQRDAIRYAISKGVTIFGSSGNDGTTGPNYPSDFDEVVSVGGTAQVGLYNRTTHGAELDVVAPAEEVLTAALDGTYASVSGTSAASPITAGIAALLLSKNPKLTPIELRSIIESTTQPVGDRTYTGNGQVDAYAALSYQGSAQIKMVTPHALDEFHIGDTIPITGSAMSTLFTGYSLSWSKDYPKDSLGFDPFGNYGLIRYDSVVSKEFDTSNSQVLSGMLGTLDTHGLDTGIYTIIFAVGSSDNRSTQERCNIRLENIAPKFVLFSVDSIWINTERALLIQATTNIPAQLEINYSAPGAKASTIGDDKIGFEHAILIQREQSQAGVPLAIDVILRAPNGDSSITHTTSTLPNEAISEEGFTPKSYTLPPGFALDSVLSLPTGDQVIETPNESGVVTAFQFDSTHTKFRAVDSIFDRGLPRALGDALGDGHAELLVQGLDTCTFGGINKICGSTRIYRQNVSHPLLGDLVFENDTEFGSTFARMLGGPAQQVVGVIDSAYYVWSQSNGHLSSIGSMVNTSPTDPYNPSNFYSEPNAAHADLRGNDTEDLVTLDDDADLIVYERDASAPTGFRAVFIDSNVAQSNGAFVTTGDFDGDGKPDIAYAFHPILE